MQYQKTGLFYTSRLSAVDKYKKMTTEIFLKKQTVSTPFLPRDARSASAVLLS